MNSPAIFFRHGADDDKSTALLASITKARAGAGAATVFCVMPNAFRQVPGSPFAYWVSPRVRSTFTRLDPFECGQRRVCGGASTKDDFRFARAWWEVPAHLLACTREQTEHERRWVAYAKGGGNAPYYDTLDLVIDWARDGEALKQFISQYRGERGWGYQWSAGLNGHDEYFKPGFSWAVRTRRFAPHSVPAGCIFSASRYQAFTAAADLEWTIALLNGPPATLLLRMCSENLERPKFIEGTVARLPFPRVQADNCGRLADLFLRCWSVLRDHDSTDESSREFLLPAALLSERRGLAEAVNSYQDRLRQTHEQLANSQRAVDDIACSAYDLARSDMDDSAATTSSWAETSNTEPDKEPDEEKPSIAYALTADALSHAVGATLGRWDLRYATDEFPYPQARAPSDALPACPPGMLQNEDGLPATETPAGYPIEIDWDGILVDDADHHDDIIARVRKVLAVIWPDRADAIEQEACEILGVKRLRDYFRKSGKGGFWGDHVKRYSKSRRKAPIYWYLRSAKGNYGLWLYYHRLDRDMLHKALINYVEPKLRLEEGKLVQLREQLDAAGTAGPEAKRLERAVDKQDAFVSELKDFEAKLRRAAELGLTPDLNDGVVLTIAPLHELVPWNEAGKYWAELLDGKYGWSSIGQQLRKRGLVAREGPS